MKGIEQSSDDFVKTEMIDKFLKALRHNSVESKKLKMLCSRRKVKMVEGNMYR